MKRAVLAVVACLVLVGGAATLLLPWGNVAAEGQRAVTITAYAWAAEDVEQGGECFPNGLSDPDGPQPWPQVIVTDAAGVIVGYVDLAAGEYMTISEAAQPACAVVADVVLEPSPFYTVTIDGMYRRTVSPALLDEADNQLFIPLF